MRKKILVTGGAGFVGSNLCEQLAADSNNDVYSLDNYSTGSKDNHVANVSYIEGSTEQIDELVNFTPEIIYHLGEYSRVEQSFDDIEKVWKYNINGIFAVLQFCRKTSAKLLYAGSSTKFADDGIGRKQSPYAFTKATNTELIESYSDWFGLDYVIVYFYNVYGKREISDGKYATLIALFNTKMQNNLPLTIVSPGTQLRNFTHVDDIINGIILVAEKGSGDGYGIGSPNAYSVLEIAKMFGGEIEMLPERKGNRHSGPVVSQKTQALGWSATRTVDDYISKMIENK